MKWLLGVTIWAVLVGCNSSGTTDFCSGLETTSYKMKAGPLLLPIESVYSEQELTGSIAISLAEVVGNALDKSQILQYDIVVKTPDGYWESQNKFAGVERFYWASVGKLFTSLAVHQLIEEGRLQLDDKLSQWFPDFPHSEYITIEMLLQHRTGVPSYNEYPFFSALLTEPTADEILDFMKDQSPFYCPGHGWNYSNTNYIFLGEIISAVEGVTYQDSINSRFGNRHESFLSLEYDSYPSDVAAITPVDEEQVLLKPSGPYAAGNIVASSSAMASLFESYLHGELLSDSGMVEMINEVYQMFGSAMYYGDGVMIYEVDDDIWVGHSGGTPGAISLLAYSKITGAIVAISFTGKGSAESIANTIFKALRANSS